MKNEYIKIIKKLFNYNIKSLKIRCCNIKSFRIRNYRIKVYKYLNEYSVTLFFKRTIIYEDTISNDTMLNAKYTINKMCEKLYQGVKNGLYSNN